MRIVLDAGALVAAERRPSALLGLLDELAASGDDVPVVPATVLAQVWRGGSGRQARLAALLSECDVRSLDEQAARSVGTALATSRTSDVVDAHVVAATQDGDVVLTSDAADVALLARAAGKQIGIVAL